MRSAKQSFKVHIFRALHLSALEEKGFIRRDPTKPRTIEILDDTFNFNRREMVNIPLIGTVAAGEPILAEERIEDYFPFPAEILPNAETFTFKGKGGEHDRSRHPAR